MRTRAGDKLPVSSLMSVERQQAVRRYLVVIQDERGYPPPGEQDEAPPDGPAPPMMHTAVLATDYDALHAALEAERGLREKAEGELRVVTVERDESRRNLRAWKRRAEEVTERAAEASQRLEEAEAALKAICGLPCSYPDDPNEDQALALSFAKAQEVAGAFLARESSEGVSSGPDGTDESERNEHG
jgi:hypothetical protein